MLSLGFVFIALGILQTEIKMLYEHTVSMGGIAIMVTGVITIILATV